MPMLQVEMEQYFIDRGEYTPKYHLFYYTGFQLKGAAYLPVDKLIAVSGCHKGNAHKGSRSSRCERHAHSDRLQSCECAGMRMCCCFSCSHLRSHVPHEAGALLKCPLPSCAPVLEHWLLALAARPPSGLDKALRGIAMVRHPCVWRQPVRLWCQLHSEHQPQRHRRRLEGGRLCDHQGRLLLQNRQWVANAGRSGGACCTPSMLHAQCAHSACISQGAAFPLHMPPASLTWHIPLLCSPWGLRVLQDPRDQLHLLPEHLLRALAGG